MTKRCQFLKYVFDKEGHSIAKCNTVSTPTKCPKGRHEDSHFDFICTHVAAQRDENGQSSGSSYKLRWAERKKRS